jgi:hypothetical protein
LLACDCDEAGCRPLEASIITDAEPVTWTGFAQPAPPDPGLPGFGDFVFDRTAYEHAVREAVEAFGQ